MDQYTMMRISDRFDDDGIDECDLNLESTDGKSRSDRFKDDYKSYYDDVKINPREDW